MERREFIRKSGALCCAGICASGIIAGCSHKDEPAVAEKRKPAENGFPEKEELIGNCGLVCSACEAFRATQLNDDNERARVAVKWNKIYGGNFKTADINCDGCCKNDRLIIYAQDICNIRKCARGQRVANCADCDYYPCDLLNEFTAKVPEAKDTLEILRRRRKRT